MDELKVTPMYELKPRLEWIGRLLGMDVYVNTTGHGSDKRDKAEWVLDRLQEKKAKEL